MPFELGRRLTQVGPCGLKGFLCGLQVPRWRQGMPEQPGTRDPRRKSGPFSFVILLVAWLATGAGNHRRPGRKSERRDGGCKISRSSAPSTSAACFDLDAGRPTRRAAALRREGSDDARRLRRHDRQRQDRPLPRAARGGGDRRHPRDRDRSQGRPGEPAAHVPRAARRGLPPVDRRGRSGAHRAQTPDDVRRSGPPSAWRKGLAEWGQDGARIARFAVGVRVRDLHARQHGRTAAHACCARSPRPPAAMLRGRRGAARPRASAVVGAAGAARRSTPTRSAAASTSCSRTPRSRLARRARPRPRRADPRDPVAAVRARRRARPRVVLPGQRSASRWRCGSTTCSRRPGFAAWLEGEPLDVATPALTPRRRSRGSRSCRSRTSRDAERMFFVTMLLNEVIAWMRAQPGTSSLRAILYMDEIFGYLPADARTRRRRRRCSRCSSRRAPTGWASCSPRRTRSTSTTRGCRTPARGSSAGCRPNATRRACSTGWKSASAAARAFDRARQIDAHPLGPAASACS